jgi:hypothetical protein
MINLASNSEIVKINDTKVRKISQILEEYGWIKQVSDK